MTARSRASGRTPPPEPNKAKTTTIPPKINVKPIEIDVNVGQSININTLTDSSIEVATTHSPVIQINLPSMAEDYDKRPNDETINPESSSRQGRDIHVDFPWTLPLWLQCLIAAGLGLAFLGFILSCVFSGREVTQSRCSCACKAAFDSWWKSKNYTDCFTRLGGRIAQEIQSDCPNCCPRQPAVPNVNLEALGPLVDPEIGSTPSVVRTEPQMGDIPAILPQINVETENECFHDSGSSNPSSTENSQDTCFSNESGRYADRSQSPVEGESVSPSLASIDFKNLPVIKRPVFLTSSDINFRICLNPLLVWGADPIFPENDQIQGADAPVNMELDEGAVLVGLQAGDDDDSMPSDIENASPPEFQAGESSTSSSGNEFSSHPENDTSDSGIGETDNSAHSPEEQDLDSGNGEPFFPVSSGEEEGNNVTLPPHCFPPFEDSDTSLSDADTEMTAYYRLPSPEAEIDFGLDEGESDLEVR